MQLENLANSFLYDKILYLTKLKALADDNLNMNKKSKLVLGKGRKHCGRGENAGFSFSHKVFEKLFF